MKGFLILGLALACGLSRIDGRAETIPAPPPGPVIEMAQPPGGAESWQKVCSVRHPLCVLATTETPSLAWLAVLDATDRAWDALTEGLEFAPPQGGLDGAWHVYLVDGVDGGGRALLESRDARTHFDRGASFGLVDRSTPAGCSLDRAVMRAVARGSLWRVAPAMDEGSAIAQVETIAALTSLCPAGTEAWAAAFQSHPERALVDPSSTAFDRGASLFFGWLDATFGSSPGVLLLSLSALSPTRTSPGASRWTGAPTTFDVLRASLRGLLWQGSNFDDVLVRFALDRASMAPAPSLAWHLAWPARARRLAAPEPVAPTGASYVRVDVTKAPPLAKLHVEADWEDYGRMRWIVAKLDASGRVLARLPIGSLDRGTSAATTVENLEGVDALLVVGVNVGSTEHTFDPDQGEWEPHGWLLTVGSE